MTNAVRVAGLGATWTTLTRPSTSTYVAGVFGYNTDVGALEYYNGTTWLSIGGADGSTEQRAAPSANALKAQGITTNGVYWIKNSLMNYAVQVYCDFSWDSGGWMLVAYGYVATTGDSTSNWAMPNLNNDASTYGYTPTNRASTYGLVLSPGGQKSGLLLHQGATQVTYAAGNNPVTGGIDSYGYVYRINIPSPASLTFANHSYTYGGATMGVSTVGVTGLKGDVGAWTRYTFTEALGATWSDTYPTGYGLASNASVRGWNGDGGPFFPSVHSGSRNTAAPGNPGLQTASPDIGVNGFERGARSYTYRGWYGATSVNNTGQTSIWVR